MKQYSLIIVAMVLIALPAEARQDAALPDLAPRQVEITGDLTIAFPALRRQPIVGFNPPPRVPDIPSNRLPYTEAYAQRSADLPPSPLQPPDPPQVSAIARRISADGLIDARIGAYLDRSLAADVTLVQSEATTLLYDLDYFGTDGQDLIVRGTPMTTGRDFFRTGFDLEQRAGALILGLDGSGFRSSYGLFGAIPDPAGPAQANASRVFSGYDGALSLSSRPGARNRLHLTTTAGSSTLDSDVFDPAVRIDPTTNREAAYVELDAGAAFPVRDGEIRFQALGTTMGLDAASFPGSTVTFGMASAELAWQYSSKLLVRAGAAVMGFDSDQQTPTDPSRSLSYLAPIIGFEYLVSEAISVEAIARPIMSSGRFDEVMRDNLIVADEPLMLPSMATLDARVGMRMQSEMVTIGLAGGWRDQPFRRIAFEPAAAARGYASGYPSLGYRSTDVIYSTVDVTIIPFRGLQIGLDALWQQAELAATGDLVPYTSPYVFGGFVSLGLLNGDLESRIEFAHETSRHADLARTQEIPAFTSVSAMVSWFFHRNYGITSGVRDMGGNPQFWRNYTYESGVFFVGFRYRW